MVACEDTRRTRVLLDRYGVDGRLVSYHEHNERARSDELVAQMRDGATVALVSDAGMPLVSDPGFVLVQACVAAGLGVEVLPGPSAALSALVASGAARRALAFVGFLPRKRAELQACWPPETVVAFESPRRLARVARGARRARPGPPGRRLPRADQAPRGGRARAAPPSSPQRYAGEPPRGEIVLVVGPAPAAKPDLEQAARARCRRSSTPAPSRARPPASSPS